MRTAIGILSTLLVIAAIIVGRFTLWDGPATAKADLANTMSVDAVSGGSIDATRTVADSGPFDVDIHIQHGGSASVDYAGYEAVLCFDSAVLDFVPTADLNGDTTVESWTYTDLGGLLVHVAVLEAFGGCPAALPDTPLYGGSIRPAGTANASGVGVIARFRCVGSGTATLHLLTEAEHVVHSTTLAASGGFLPTDLADAAITCSLPPTPTACPPEVCTPTATPTPTQTPTSTPTPDLSPQPNVMSVDAVSGDDIDAERQVPVGSQYDVDIHIQHGGSASVDYAGYEAALCFDSTVLDFVPTADLTGDTTVESWTYTDLGGMFLQAAMSESPSGCPAAFPDTWLYGGAVRAAGTTSASGAAIQARFACVAEGTSTLHLVAEEDHAYFSSTLAVGGPRLPTNLADATVTCMPDTDGDRCGDLNELTMGFRPVNPSDFFTVPVPADSDGIPNGPRDAAVAMPDVLAVLFYVGTYEGDTGDPNPNGVAYDTVKGSCPVPYVAGTVQKEGLCYDRSAGPLPNPPWEVGPPDGAVSMDDVLANLAQVGLDCRAVP